MPDTKNLQNTRTNTLNNKSESPHHTLAQQLKAAADPLRLDILRVMASGSFGVLELCRLFKTKQSGMSHHLKVLTNAGWITSRREGNSIFYRRAHLNPESPQSTLQQQLFHTLDAQPLDTIIALGIATIQMQRSALSQQFFSDNANKFREQQDLIARYPVYAEQVLELLESAPLATASNQPSRVLEIGPGEGECLLSLATRFDQVTALDNSEAMLDKAKKTAQHLTNIEFIHADSATLISRGKTSEIKTAEQNTQYHAIVVNMVLHHTPNPREIFADASALLQSDGVLLITDLCRHDQSWVIEACGDLWQGFDPEDFSLWASENGLREGQAIYFALRNGFQIQVRQFFKSRTKTEY